MRVEEFFSQAERELVEKAVGAAEGRTSGEIVPVVVAHSDEYFGAAWKGAALGALGMVLLAEGLHWWVGAWGLGAGVWIVLPAVLGAGLGFALASWVSVVRRLVISDEEMEREVRQRAVEAFVTHEVFATQERTGVLILLSLFEHRVVVLGDSGINARVAPGEWDEIVAGVVAGIKRGQPGQALVEAIGRCGELLHRQGVERRTDDANELPDRLRLERE
ncbi:MAG: TPM domain-containing protein [Thermoanaerobaculaceae bacterium]